MKQLNVLAITCLFFISLHSHAQETYEDPGGQFIIDLFDGLKDLEQVNDLVYQFKNESYGIIAQKNKDTDDLDSAFSIAVDNLINSGLKKLETVEAPTLITVNGNQAMKALYTSDFEAEGVTVVLIGMVYAIALEESTLSAMVILNNNSYEKSNNLIEKTLYSIRRPTQELSGVTEEKVLDLSVEDVLKVTEVETTTEPTNVNYGGVSFTLPVGWLNQEKGRGDAENIIGKFKNNVLSSSGFIMGLKGIIWNMKRANQVAFEIGRDALPESVLVKSEEISINNKKKGFFHQHKGTAVAEGQEVEMTAITMVHKVGKQFLVYFVTSGYPLADGIEKDLLAIASSAQ